MDIKEHGDVNKRIMLLVPCRGSGGQMTGRQGHSALTCLLTHSVNIPLCVCVCVFERDHSSSTLGLLSLDWSRHQISWG